MTESAHSTNQAVVAFLREEAPLEFERLRSIVELAQDRPEAVAEAQDPVPLSHPRWVRESLGSLAS